VEDAFKIALDIESSEIDAIYSKLLHLGGPKIAKVMENLGVPASVQRQKLKPFLLPKQVSLFLLEIFAQA